MHATLEGQDATIPIPPRLRGAVGRVTSGKLVAGFRPDHLDLGTGGPDMATIRGRADVVEYLGAQELLHVSAAGKDIVAIVNASRQVHPGDSISLVLPLDKLHLFDSETGVSVTQLVGDMPATDVTAADGTTRTAIRPPRPMPERGVGLSDTGAGGARGRPGRRTKRT